MATKRSVGNMYMYDAAQLITIDAANQYHALTGFSAGATVDSGLVFSASLTGSITNTADGSPELRCTSVSHGLSTGMYVTLTGMGDAAHVGVTRVTVVTPDVFDCDDIAYNSVSDTGTWTKGSAFTVQSGHGGVYLTHFTASISSAGANKDYKIEVYKNAVAVDEIATERNLATATDLGVVFASGPVLLSGGDVIWLATNNTTDSTNLTIQHANLNVHRV